MSVCGHHVLGVNPLILKEKNTFLAPRFLFHDVELHFAVQISLASGITPCIIPIIERRRRQRARVRKRSPGKALRTARRTPSISKCLLHPPPLVDSNPSQTGLGFFSSVPGECRRSHNSSRKRAQVVAILAKSLDFACVRIATASIIYGFSAMPAGKESGRACKNKQEGQVLRTGRRDLQGRVQAFASRYRAVL